MAAAQPSVSNAGPPSEKIDSVSAAVTEASRRFSIPESWIRAVMQKESSRDIAAVSPAGAIGLMQVMPDTYAELRARYGLGDDPFDIRDNVLAGTAYLREMFDRYGAAGFLAAYNAGPQRWEDHLASGQSLPAETVSYVAELGATLDVAVPQIDLGRTSQARPSPFDALIFVAIDGAGAGVDPSNDLQEKSRDVAGEPAPKAPTDSLFVRSTTAVRLHPATSSRRPENATPPPERPPSTSSGKATMRPGNGLFAPRSASPEQ